MKQFLDDNFLLSNKVSEELYHDHAKHLPIIDYHNHLSPRDIANDRQFKTITAAWLEGDHYKWRAMRANGINEEFITGKASDDEKFQKWAETVPFTMRNPLYHWTHLELKRYFEIDELLSGSNAKEIYNETSIQLGNKTHSCMGLLRRMKVETLCTTDDPTDDLSYHKRMMAGDANIKVFPTFRPDKALAFNDLKAYRKYIAELSSVSGVNIISLDSLLSALENRIDYFHEVGCRLSDHGFTQLPLINEKARDLAREFTTVLEGKFPCEETIENLQAYLLTELSKLYYKKGWTQQFHLNVLRNNNSRAMQHIGPDSGFDSIGDAPQATRLQSFFDHLDKTDQLTKTIVYNLNPSDNDLFATMAGNFNDGKIVGKMQFGSGWWFLDQKHGIENQLNSLSNMGLLSHFVGMLTDSRSFLSFPRHEYFRRILCNIIGTDVVNGELPYDIGALGQLVRNIAYYNAKKYLAL